MMIGALLLAVAAPVPAGYAGWIDEAIDGGRIIQAEAMLAQWRTDAKSDDRGEIEIALARIALEKRRDEEAARDFAALASAGVKDCRVDEGLGVALVRLGRAQQALPLLKRAVATCKGRWRAWNALGIAYDQQQSWAAGAAAYETAFQLTDKPAQILKNYGLSLLRQDQPTKAAAIFEKARELAPEDTTLIAYCDTAYVRSGQDIERGAAESADQWARRLSHAGQVALEMGDGRRAQAYLSRAVTEGDNFMPEAADALARMGLQKP